MQNCHKVQDAQEIKYSTSVLFNLKFDVRTLKGLCKFSGVASVHNWRGEYSYILFCTLISFEIDCFEGL